MRTPSSLNSTDAGPVAASASPTSVAVDASIGWIATPTVSRTAASAAAPSVRASRAVAGRSPLSIAARHAGGAGHGVGHQARERALAELSGQQPAHELGLGLGQARAEPGEQVGAAS